MTFEEFLNALAPKIGPKNAFDLSQDSQLGTLRKLLISKGVFSEEEYNAAQSEEFDQIANKILKLKLDNKENGKV